MTKTVKKKHVVQEVLSWEDDRIPAENERLVRVLSGRGNDLHYVEEIEKGEKFLVSMPGKFRKTIWVKRGDYLIVTNIPEGGKVKAEITEILTKKRISYFKKIGLLRETEEDFETSSEKDFVNENRNAPVDSDDSNSSYEESN